MYSIFFILNVFHYILTNKKYFSKLNFSTVLNSKKWCRNVLQSIHMSILIVHREPWFHTIWTKIKLNLFIVSKKWFFTKFMLLQSYTWLLLIYNELFYYFSKRNDHLTIIFNDLLFVKCLTWVSSKLQIHVFICPPSEAVSGKKFYER